MKTMKISFKRIMSIMLAAIFFASAFSLVGCNSGGEDEGAKTIDQGITTTAPQSTTAATDATTAAKKEYSKKTYKMQEIADKLNVLGRCAVGEKGLAADWSASGFELVADCKNLVKITIVSTHACRFNLYIDNGELKTINVSAGKKTYTIANDLEAGVHSFRFVKSSMVEHGTKALAVDIESIELYGEIGEAKKRDRLIEFVGDSITCGVGASSPTDTEAYSELSYAYLLANKLDTDYSLVSVSGIGAGKSTDRHGGTLMGDVYPLTNYYRSKTDKYSTERKADLVVINLNTNDKGSFAESQKAEFTAKVKELIEQVKSVHGEDVKILWVMGMMSPATSGLCDIWTIQYLSSLGGESAGYYYAIVTQNRAGGASHPIASAHATVAQELEKFIADKGILG